MSFLCARLHESETNKVRRENKNRERARKIMTENVVIIMGKKSTAVTKAVSAEVQANVCMTIKVKQEKGTLSSSLNELMLIPWIQILLIYIYP